MQQDGWDMATILLHCHEILYLILMLLQIFNTSLSLNQCHLWVICPGPNEQQAMGPANPVMAEDGEGQRSGSTAHARAIGPWTEPPSVLWWCARVFLMRGSPPMAPFGIGRSMCHLKRARPSGSMSKARGFRTQGSTAQCMWPCIKMYRDPPGRYPGRGVGVGISADHGRYTICE